MTIAVRRQEQVEILILDRPGQENKLNIPCMTQLVRALRAAEADPSCRVVILTAKGPYFCNGGELGDFRRKSPLAIRDFGKAFIDLHTTIVTLTKPVIAAVQGNVMGGGFSLVEACDLAVVAEEAVFGVPEIKTGLAPMMALTGVARVFPRKRVLEMAYFGEGISAAEACQYGLVNRVCPRAQVMEEALALAAKIAEKNPTAIGLCKKLYSDIDNLDYKRQLETGLNMLVSLLKSEDAAEALTAREEGRPPVWTGL